MRTWKKNNSLKIHSNSFPVNFSLPAHSAEKHLFTNEEAVDKHTLEHKFSTSSEQQRRCIYIMVWTALSSPQKASSQLDTEVQQDKTPAFI